MNKKYPMTKSALIFLSFIVASGCNSSCEPDPTTSSHVSGTIRQGLRIIDLSPETETDFTVFRGDYVVFISNKKDMTLEIPYLNIFIKTTDLVDPDKKIKMKDLGNYPLLINDRTGTLHVINYIHSNYSEISSQDAPSLIRNLKPLILDVRTQAEYQSGHIHQAKLIPVQELQKRMNELNAYKDETILVYCRSGNRSTVASKLLIDSGFERIYNLREGILGWIEENHDIEK